MRKFLNGLMFWTGCIVLVASVGIIAIIEYSSTSGIVDPASWPWIVIGIVGAFLIMHSEARENLRMSEERHRQDQRALRQEVEEKARHDFMRSLSTGFPTRVPRSLSFDVPDIADPSEFKPGR